MELTDIQKLSTPELVKEIALKRADLQKLRFDVATMKDTKVHKVAVLKKTIAQMNTVLGARNRDAAKQPQA